MTEETSVPVDILNKMFSVPELAELATPTPFSLMPQTAARYWLAALFVCIAVFFRVKHHLRWKRDLWRREALAELKQTELKGNHQQLPALIKRILLVHISREKIHSSAVTGQRN